MYAMTQLEEKLGLQKLRPKRIALTIAQDRLLEGATTPQKIVVRSCEYTHMCVPHTIDMLMITHTQNTDYGFDGTKEHHNGAKIRAH